ncbi:MAG: hypothetical protein ACKVVT_06220 [Dehalococcoidia bacterium]
MSELQKRIQKVQRRETGARLGFGPVTREQPRAMLLIARVADANGATAGADAVVVVVDSAAAAAVVVGGLDKKSCRGALVPALDEAGAVALRQAGSDFAISALDTTAAIAVKTDDMGHVVDASGPLDEATLRAMAPLGLDGLFVDHSAGGMTLGQQLGLVRLATLANTPLLVGVAAGATVEELRVLRDSGCGGVVAPLGASAEELVALAERLKAVPAPSKGKKREDSPTLPSMFGGSEAEHDHDDDDDE